MSGGEVSPEVLPDVYSWSTLAQLNYLKKTLVLLVGHSPLQGTGSLDSAHFSVDHATARVTMTSLLVYIRFAVTVGALVSIAYCQEADISKCGSSGQKLKYIWGDALIDDPNCIGLNNQPYPAAHIARNFKKSNPWGLSARTGRASHTIDPYTTQRALLRSYEMTHHLNTSNRTSREMRADSCGAGPTRVCQTRYNTTAPLYGISLTSGQPVTIVQKFPDLLQQVIYEVCETKECEVIRGECTQTYVPYLFLVIPLGPVTLTGQDYVLVESGCVCKPKKSTHLNTVT